MIVEPLLAAPVETPMSVIDFRPVSPSIGADIVERNCDSIAFRPESPKSVPFCTSAVVLPLTTGFSVRSARAVLTTSL